MTQPMRHNSFDIDSPSSERPILFHAKQQARQFRVVNGSEAMAEEVGEVMRLSFATLDPSDRTNAEYYRRYVRNLPDGQFVVLNEHNEVAACSTDILAEVDLVDFEHRSAEVFRGLWPKRQTGEKDWLYGADICVRPDHRGLGLSKLLYKARHDFVRRHNLRGHVAGGMLRGYSQYKRYMSAQTYLDKVVRGEIFDPTVSVQLRRGFQVYGLLPDYVLDSSCDNNAAFIVWHNPDYRAPAPA